MNLDSLLSIARGIISSPDTSGLDNVTNKFHYVALMKFESHYVHQVSVHCVSETFHYPASLRSGDITDIFDILR